MATKKSYLNAFEKASTTSYFKDYTKSNPNGTFIRENRFGGAICKLNALEATIYDFCNAWYMRYERGMNTEAPVQTFDNMRYYFLSLNQRAYMDLLD